MFKYTFFLLLITAIFAKKVAVRDEVALQASIADLFKCISEAEPVVKDVTSLVAAIKAKDFDQAIELIYTLVTDGNTVVLDCIKLVPQIEEILKKLIKFNWDDFMKCVLDTKPVAKEVLQLVQLIVAKDYGKVLAVVYQLYLDGSSVVKECIAVFKTELELQFNWKGLLNCALAVAPKVPEVAGLIKKLVSEIKSKNYVAAATTAYQILAKAGAAFKTCKKYF